MAYEIPGFSFTLPAAVDLSSSEFTFVTTDANGLANVPATQGSKVFGSLNNKPKVGEAATIVHGGIAQVTAGAAIPLLAGGTPVMTTTAGFAIPYVAGSGVVIAGYALEAATASGIIIAVLLSQA